MVPVATRRKSRREGSAAEIVVTVSILVRLAGHPSALRTDRPLPNLPATGDGRSGSGGGWPRSLPTWGRPEATQSGGGLLAPLPPERKYANQRGGKAASPAAQGLSCTMRIALYQPDIPQNTGTILRLCACVGIEAHIIGPTGFPASDRAFRRAGMDYLDAVVIVRHRSWQRFRIHGAAAAGATASFCSRPPAPVSYLDYRYRADDILLFGRESAGVSGRGPCGGRRPPGHSNAPRPALAQCRDCRGHGRGRGVAADGRCFGCVSRLRDRRR